MKRVLVITYYWPPSGGAGVQRWLKFTKYLPEFGWQPVIYTPQNPEAPVEDFSLLSDIHPQVLVIKRRIWEPYRLYKRFMGIQSGTRINAGFLSEQEKPEKKEGISVWIRGNMFIPDARKFWIKPSVRFLLKHLKKNPVDAIISTGPPHSMHMIALHLKRRLGLPWIADFRDPWTGIDYYDHLKLSKRADKKHISLEKSVLETSDKVVVIGKSMRDQFRQIVNIDPVVIPNGFDEDDFKNAKGEVDEHFTILHVGAINKDRNHIIFWKSISDLIKEGGDISSVLRIKLIGKLDHSVLTAIKNFGIDEITELIPYIPHNQVAEALLSASLLYLPINNTANAKSIQTGKIFEYIASGLPILGIGPIKGDASEILNTSKAGVMVDFEDEMGLKSAIVSYWEASKKGKREINATYMNYSRRVLTEKLAHVLNEILI